MCKREQERERVREKESKTKKGRESERKQDETRGVRVKGLKDNFKSRRRQNNEGSSFARWQRWSSGHYYKNGIAWEPKKIYIRTVALQSHLKPSSSIGNVSESIRMPQFGGDRVRTKINRIK